MSRYARDDPPPRNGPQLKLFRIRAEQTRIFVLLGLKAHPFGTHWNGLRSVPCTIPKEECRGHLEGWPYRWKCYIHVWDVDSKEEGFLEFTQIALEQFTGQLSVNEKWRGLQIRVQRGKGLKTRLKIDVLGTPINELEVRLPEEKDPEPTLRELWEFRGKSQRGSSSPEEGR